MTTPLYPLKFKPIYKERIWGGNKLKTVLEKDVEFDSVGESWELSTVKGDISVIANGDLKGQSFQDLINTRPIDILGFENHKRFGKDFPLLIKFIDAKEDLSIQLHPNDELAQERHDSFGKTEMWYVMQAEHNANLIVGFKEDVTSNTYLQHLKDKTLTEILNFDKVSKGDTYFIEAGRVHAIGAGVLLAEIQQTSDVTYRVYDWDRVDKNGKGRELHNDLALEAINFNMDNDFKKNYNTQLNISNSMVECPFFKTSFLPINGSIQKQNDLDSFIIYMCVEGKVVIDSDSTSVTLSKGETALLPAAIKNYILTSEKAELLEVYV